MTDLLIVGASGHGRVAADIARLSGRYGQIDFVDDDDSRHINGYEVIGTLADADRWIKRYEFFVAVGDNRTRQAIMRRLEEKGARFVTLIHPSAVVAAGVQVGHGSMVAANGVVNPGSRVGQGVIVNTAATVDHDCLIQNFVHISPGAHLGGTVQVGALTWIGIGAVVSNNVEICPGCIVGAGAAVIMSLDRPATYVGVPAKAIEPVQRTEYGEK